MRKFLVVFSDTIQYQVYDECDHSKDFHANRESGVVGEYQNSSLIEYLKSEPLLELLSTTNIVNEDFQDFFNFYEPTENDFIFLDPPYDTEFNTYAQNDFAKSDHFEKIDTNWVTSESTGVSLEILADCLFLWIWFLEFTLRSLG